jgi:hypothetical protein
VIGCRPPQFAGEGRWIVRNDRDIRESVAGLSKGISSGRSRLRKKFSAISPANILFRSLRRSSQGGRTSHKFRASNFVKRIATSADSIAKPRTQIKTAGNRSDVR